MILRWIVSAGIFEPTRGERIARLGEEVVLYSKASAYLARVGERNLVRQLAILDRMLARFDGSTQGETEP